MTQDNQNNTKNKNKKKDMTSESAPRSYLESKPSGETTRSQHLGRPGVSTKSKKDQTIIVFIHQNINYLLKEYNRLLIKDY